MVREALLERDGPRFFCVLQAAGAWSPEHKISRP